LIAGEAGITGARVAGAATNHHSYFRLQ